MELSDIFKNRSCKLDQNKMNISLKSLYISDVSDKEFNFLTGFLNTDESYKCQTFFESQIAKKYTICRVFSKFMLASILKKDISTIKFLYGPWKKPYLSDRALYFNISHSHNLCVIGISSTHEVGVDIEWILEKNCIERFYKVWTLKESILKYIGKGISKEGFPKLLIANNQLFYPSTKTNTFIYSNKYSISLCKAENPANQNILNYKHKKFEINF